MRRLQGRDEVLRGEDVPERGTVPGDDGKQQQTTMTTDENN
jgi:hypothetical protein